MTLVPSLASFTPTPTTEISTLSLHDALPIWTSFRQTASDVSSAIRRYIDSLPPAMVMNPSAPWVEWSMTSYRRESSSRSEEHTSELQSHSDLVCRLLLEKKK